MEQTLEEKQKPLTFRPSSSYLESSKSIDPSSAFLSLQPLDESKIKMIASYNEKSNDQCESLTKMLEFRTSPDRSKVKELESRFKSHFHQRKKTIENFSNPSFIPDHKLIQGSSLVQLAYLDKIIEDCETETEKKIPKKMDRQVDQFIENMQA